MKLFKRIVYSLLGLIMTLTIALIGIILYSEYSGKQIFSNSAGKEYANLAPQEESRLVDEEGDPAEVPTDSAGAEAANVEMANAENAAPAEPAQDSTSAAQDNTAAAQDNTAAAQDSTAAAQPAQDNSPENGGSPKVYVLNTESAIFHYSDCELVSQIKQDSYSTMTAVRSDVTGRGYEPCSVCNP